MWGAGVLEVPSGALGPAPHVRAGPVEPGDQHVKVGRESVEAGVKLPEGSTDRSALPDNQPPARGRVDNRVDDEEADDQPPASSHQTTLRATSSSSWLQGQGSAD